MLYDKYNDNTFFLAIKIKGRMMADIYSIVDLSDQLVF